MSRHSETHHSEAVSLEGAPLHGGIGKKICLEESDHFTKGSLT